MVLPIAPLKEKPHVTPIPVILTVDHIDGGSDSTNSMAVPVSINDDAMVEASLEHKSDPPPLMLSDPWAALSSTSDKGKDITLQIVLHPESVDTNFTAPRSKSKKKEAVSRGHIGRYIDTHYNVSHLSFADDLMLFTDCSASSAKGFAIPKKTINTIHKILRRFLWSGDSTNCKQCAVKWDLVCSPRSEGGLGLKSLLDWNTASLGVRFWEIASNHPSLWAQWIRRRYLRKENLWNASEVSSSSSLWRKILSSKSWVRSLTQYVIFEGHSINIWDDPWLHGFGLRHHFHNQTLLLWGPINQAKKLEEQGQIF
ncbi:putative ribonuclease H protein [Acorus calamus]|uniref:Ribonuclease H protein n=1 Tax=Acorus calamus TaxID=4465 RepID=A0AAV9DWP0_ACOCL|nr:putative ribonuclease H protein [Acorus calamus]